MKPARLLLDTHVVLWWLADDPTLATDIKDMIDNEVEVYVSAATVWELAIKQSLGKVSAPTNLAEAVRDSELTQLPIDADHAIVAGRLPLIHRDPFDRMLVAQARCLGLQLATRDAAIGNYDASILAV